MRWLFIATTLMLGGIAHAKVHSGQFGVGLMVGEPSGLSFKLLVDKRHALAAGLSFSLIDGNLHAHGDYLLHFPGKIHGIQGGKWIPYVGIGGKLRVWESEGKKSGESGIGVRIPLGLALHARGAPVDFFLEFVPGMRILPETKADFGGALGGRWYF
jgi:hypothetical protein